MHDELQKETHEDEINLLDYWRVLVKYKKLIAFIVGFSFIASVVISLLLPKIYASTARIFAPQKERAIVDQWVGFLNSQTLRGIIIDKFDLKNVYAAKTIDGARMAFDRNVSIKKSNDGIVSITVEDKDPERAAKMANGLVEELDRFNREVVMSSGRRIRIFVEKQLEEAQEKLAETEKGLRDFQDKNKAIKMDDWSKAIINPIGMVNVQLMAKEVELQTMVPFATPDNSQVEMLRGEVTALRGRLKEIEEGSNIGTPGSGQQNTLTSNAKMPNLGLQYGRLLRDFIIQDTVFELLTRQYEMARVQEVKDSPAVQILDFGKVPERKAKPRRSRIVILLVFLSVFLAVFLAFFLEYIERIKANESLGSNYVEPSR